MTPRAIPVEPHAETVAAIREVSCPVTGRPMRVSLCVATQAQCHVACRDCMAGYNARQARGVPEPEPIPGAEMIKYTQEAALKTLAKVQPETPEAIRAEIPAVAGADPKPCKGCGELVTPWLRYGTFWVREWCVACLDKKRAQKTEEGKQRARQAQPGLPIMPAFIPPLSPRVRGPHVDVDLARVPEVWDWLVDLAEREDRAPEAQVRHILRGMHRTCAA